MKLDKIYEDTHILVINKPAGLIVNRSKTASGETLQDMLEEHYHFSDENADFVTRSGLVHRLDKDTSGVLVVALSLKAFENLLSQFKSREVTKEYIAVTHGELPKPLIEINAPIARNPDMPTKFAIVASGRPSFTRVERIKEVTVNGNLYTLSNVFPKTGRTHQIRVHLAALRSYIVNDPIYCPRNLLEQGKDISSRMMLHAHKIRLVHPDTGAQVEYTAEKPHDFEL